MDNKKVINEGFQEKKKTLIQSIKELLLFKNKKYGNAALDPSCIFYKGDSVGSIEIRLDDKINRIINSSTPRKDDVSDTVGYLFLYMIAKNFYASEGASSPDKLKTFSWFEARLKDVCNGIYKEMEAPNETLGMLTKLPAYVSQVDDFIAKHRGGSPLAITEEDTKAFTMNLMYYMINMDYIDLSEFMVD